jgi:hypothetical protein
MKKKPVLRQLTVLVLAADQVELTAMAVERGLVPAQLLRIAVHEFLARNRKSQ